MSGIGRLFLKGLAAILPIALTLWLLWWLGATAENLLAPVFKRLLPNALYVRGLGVAFGFVLVLGVGLLMHTILARQVLTLGERILVHIPVVKTVYGALKDTIALFTGEEKKKLGQVVLVRWGDPQTRLLGFLTREDLTDFPAAGADHVAVYLPMSYQIGGYTVIVPRSAVEPIAMSAEDALRFTVTAGMSGRPKTV